MVEDMVSLLRIPKRFSEEESSVGRSWGPLEESVLEQESRAGFSPLMALFPRDLDEHGWSVPWSPLDMDLVGKLK